MKKIIILIITYSLISSVYADTDSLNCLFDSNYCNEIIDSNLIQENNLVILESSANKMEKKVENKKVKKAKNFTKPANWFEDAWDFFTDLFKPVWGHYEEDGQRSEGPYFMFDRTYDGSTFTQIQMKNIQDKIKISGSKELILYRSIFELAGTTTIENCNGVIIPNFWDGNKLCGAAARAKASAFVYLVGLNDSGTALSTADRDGYRNRALGYLRDVKIQGLNNTFDYIRWIPMDPVSYLLLNTVTNTVAAVTQWSQMVWRAKELQMICQAWDMLRWCYNIDPALPNDNIIRSRLNEAAERIINNYVVPLHIRAQYGTYRFAHNNYNLIVGSALASAAICFHDFGAYLWMLDSRPTRWASSAYYNIHKVMWNDGNIYGTKMSKPRDTYGYAEGTHYFNFAFENMLPMFLARNNFASANKVVGYNSFFLDPDPYYVRNFWHDEDYHNIYRWYNNLIQSNGKAPAIDESYTDQNLNPAMAILRKHKGEQYNFIDDGGFLFSGSGFSLLEDYLAALTPPVKKDLPKSIKMASGDAVIRSRDIDPDKHYLYINAEVGSAANGGWHEHEDFGSFIITADDDILMMDPPTFKDGNNEINKIVHHNTLSMDESFPSITNSSDIKDLGGSATSETYKLNSNAHWKRTFLVNRDGVKDINGNMLIGYHYIIYDKVVPFQSGDFSFNFNGNGNDITHINTVPGKIDWTYPCVYSGNTVKWGIRAQITPSITTGAYQLINTAKNGSGEGLPESQHTRYTYKVNTSDVFSVTTFLQPRKCTANGTLGKTSSKSTNKYGSILIYDDSINNPKLIYIGKNTLELDTLKNPLNIDPLSVLSTNAKLTSFCYGLDSIQNTGYCIAYSKFRQATLFNGDSLLYNNQFYIKANKRADIQYKLVGKYKYQGYIQCDSIDSVSFYLPDLDSNYAMGANGKGLTYVYNDTTHIITLIAPVGYTEFIIQLADPCVMNCYFPTDTDSIKNTFDFANGIPEALPYKLTITPPNGLLKISNASKLQICSHKWLRNNDSLIMEGPCPRIPTRPNYVICPDLSAGGVGPNIEMQDFNDKSEITISDYAALILDSGSYTRFGNNTRLIVEPYGSLIIRKNAIVDVGDEKGCGYAEIICHPNSYVQFEDSADIKFWKKENDTNDIHIFYISVLPSRTATHAGIEPSMATMLTNVDAIPFGTAAPICSVAQIRAGYGINNRDWGFANFALPKAWAYISQDTFCPGQCPTINFDRMLNDTKRSIKFCRIDTNYTVSPPQAIFNTCIYPDIKGGNGGAIGGGDLCDTLQYIGPLTICNPLIDDPGKWYKITLISYNDCDQMDSINLYYYNQNVLNPSFTLAQTGCTNNIKAYENNDTISRKYREKTKWHVHVIDTTNTNVFAPPIQYGGDWEYNNLAFPDTFNFPNFKWYGGFKYAVSHTVSTNYCGDTTSWDSIVIIPGAFIKLSRPNVFGQPVAGNTSVQLNGYLSSADSFSWYPNTWLNRTDTLSIISIPTDSITYILTAYKDRCIATDTAHIKYNRYANAGYADTLCFDSTHSTETLIGFPYDMSLFLGMLYYYDNTQFMSYYNSHNTGNISNYFRYFTHFMHTDNFKNSATSCTVDLFNLFTNTLQKELFFSKSWYRGYYMQFTQFNNPGLNALNIFADQVINNTTLKNHLDSLNNWGNIDPCINDILNLYDDYVQNHRNEITTTWSKIVNNDTTNLTNWNNFFVAENAPTKSSKYILSVIAPSVAEIDEITILVDTILTPLFAPAMQFDSTIYLMNYTEPNSKATHYEWNFGDGSANSFETHPIHTFPAFDSNYVVCLIASNFCSSFTYCDTVWIDSLHLGGTLYTKKQTAFYEINNASNKTVLQNETNYKPGARSQQLVALINYPNPFNNSTIIDYEIWQNYTNAELRITNVLGQTLFTQKLNKPIDKIHVDGGALSNGIYYYSIIIDGTVSQTKNMSVIH